MMKVRVLVEFADREDFYKRYGVGDEVSFVDSEYVRMLVWRGIAEAAEGLKDGDSDVSDIDLSKQWNNVVAAVKVFGDVGKLQQYLDAENANAKPRATVVKAIEARLAELAGEDVI